MNVPQTEMNSLKEVNSLLMKKMEALCQMFWLLYSLQLDHGSLEGILEWWNHDPGASLDIDDCLHRDRLINGFALFHLYINGSYLQPYW